MVQSSNSNFKFNLHKNICLDKNDSSLNYLTVLARIKLRESGKTLDEDNPNPSFVEIH